MLNTLGVVLVPRGADLTAAQVGRKLGGKSVLEWVVRRATDCQRLDRVVVALADDVAGRVLGQLVPTDVATHFSAAADGLAQCIDVVDEHPARAVVTICPQNLFLDPVLIDRLVSTAEIRVGCDYIGFRGHDGQSAAEAASGLFGEWCRTDALRRAGVEAHYAVDRNCVMRYVYSRPEEFGTLWLPLPAMIDVEDVRRRIDSNDDWESTQTMCDSLGPEDWAWHRIAEFAGRVPATVRTLAA